MVVSHSLLRCSLFITSFEAFPNLLASFIRRWRKLHVSWKSGDVSCTRNTSVERQREGGTGEGEKDKILQTDPTHVYQLRMCIHIPQWLYLANLNLHVYVRE